MVQGIKRDTIVYDDWKGGNWGSDGPVAAARLNPKRYRAINLQVYANGTLGPRPGWKELTPAGGTAPTSASNTDYYGAVWVPVTGTTYGMILFVSKSTAASTKRFDLDSLTWLTSTLGTQTLGPDSTIEANGASFTYLNTQQIIVGGTSIYDISANTTLSLTHVSSFAPNSAIFYKERLYTFGDATFPNRVYVSDAGAFSTFVVGQYFDVGGGGSGATSRPKIRGAWNIKDGLLFLVTAGSTSQVDAAGEWWMLQGAVPPSASLKRIAKGRVPLFGSLLGEQGGALVGMDHSTGRGAMIMDGALLDSKALDFIRPGGEIYAFSAGRNVATTFGEPAVIMPFIVKSTYDTTNGFSTAAGASVGLHSENGMQAWELVHGVWTKATWWNGAMVETVTNASKMNLLYGCGNLTSNILWAITNDTPGAGPSGGDWRLYSRDVCLDRPAFSSDTWSTATETHSDLLDSKSTGLFSQLWLPEEYADLGYGRRVRRVTVDFDYWKISTTTPASTADMTCMVRYRSIQAGTDKVTDIQEDVDLFDNLAATTGRFPGQGRVTFNFPEEAYYGSVQVIFPSVRNIALRYVYVDLEEKAESVWAPSAG